MASIFDRINMNKLRYVGSGCSNICLTDGKYAIKIGGVSDYDSHLMKVAYQSGYGVMVYAYAKDVNIPQSILNIISNYGNYRSSGDSVAKWVFFDILKTATANVMIMELAKPYLRHDYTYTKKYTKRAYKVAESLANAFQNETGYKWEDSHPWNMGKINGRLVILDF